MKKRDGFVSNSSSSSFVLSCATELDAMLNVQVNLIDIGVHIKTLEELDGWFVKEHGYRASTLERIFADDPYLKELYDKMAAAIGAGRVIVAGDISNDSGDDAISMLYNEGISRLVNANVEVLYGE